jgi:putative ABC transport system substrate-binding protein
MSICLRRREFMAALGGAAAWPLTADAQPSEPTRRIGALLSFAPDDPQERARIAAFHQALQELGWTVGRNVQIDYRWGAGDPELYRKYAEELIALKPVLILAQGSLVVRALQLATRTVPIVFANVIDPKSSKE